MTPRFIFSTLLGAGVAIAGVSPAFAQTSSATTPATTSSPAAATGHAAKINAHIDRLRAELKITQAERPQWHTLATVMRRNATHMETLYRQRSRNADTMNAVQILKAYRGFTRAHLKALDHLIPAFTKLYNVLSPAQKKTADELFENRVAAASGAKKGTQ